MWPFPGLRALRKNVRLLTYHTLDHTHADAWTKGVINNECTIAGQPGRLHSLVGRRSGGTRAADDVCVLRPAWRLGRAQTTLRHMLHRRRRAPPRAPLQCVPLRHPKQSAALDKRLHQGWLWAYTRAPPVPFSLIFLPRLELYLAARAKRRQAEGGSKGAAASEGKAPAQPSTPPKNQDTKAPGMKEDASASAAAPETLTEV